MYSLVPRLCSFFDELRRKSWTRVTVGTSLYKLLYTFDIKTKYVQMCTRTVPECILWYTIVGPGILNCVQVCTLISESWVCTSWYSWNYFVPWTAPLNRSDMVQISTYLYIQAHILIIAFCPCPARLARPKEEIRSHQFRCWRVGGVEMMQVQWDRVGD